MGLFGNQVNESEVNRSADISRNALETEISDVVNNPAKGSSSAAHDIDLIAWRRKPPLHDDGFVSLEEENLVVTHILINLHFFFLSASIRRGSGRICTSTND
jgi:hypothetical protein